MRRWDLQTGQELERIEQFAVELPVLEEDSHFFQSFPPPVDLYSPPLDSIAQFAPDGQLLFFINSDSGYKLWDLTTQEQIQGLQPPFAADSLVFSANGQRVATYGDLHVTLWERDGSILKPQLKRRIVEESVTDRGFLPVFAPLATSDDGRFVLLTGRYGWANRGEFSVIQFWDTQTDTIIKTLTGHQGFINAADFSPDGSLLASVSEDRTLRLWNVATGELVQTLGQPWEESIGLLALSPDQTLLAAGRMHGEIITLHDAETGEPRFMLDGAKNHQFAPWLSSLAFSPDGRLLAVGVTDGTFQLWDLQTQEELLSERERSRKFRWSGGPQGVTQVR